MAPVSVIPGRLRLESSDLINKRHHCRILENKISALKGVMSVEANPRTGRLLIIFNELMTDADSLRRGSKDILREMKDVQNCEITDVRAVEGKNGSSGIGNAIAHAAIDIAGHVLMPKPFNFLIPIAVNAMRKNS